MLWVLCVMFRYLVLMLWKSSVISVCLDVVWLIKVISCWLFRLLMK